MTFTVDLRTIRNTRNAAAYATPFFSVSVVYCAIFAVHYIKSYTKLYSLPEQSILMMQCSTRQIAQLTLDKMFAVNRFVVAPSGTVSASAT